MLLIKVFRYQKGDQSIFRIQGWYAEFMLEIDLEVLLRKTGARLNLKIDLIFLHINPEIHSVVQDDIKEPTGIRQKIIFRKRNGS